MRRQILLGTTIAVVAGTTATLIQSPAVADAEDGASPDVIVGQISGVEEYGSVDGIASYAIGTTACNNGPTLLGWQDDGDTPWRHPVIAQNAYRLHDGRFEQIGMSWLKHGFCAADSTVCGACTPFGSCDFLGPGCSDTYVAQLNGFQIYLGPRSEVDPTTGVFAWPHGLPGNVPTLSGRLLIANDDLDDTLYPGARYFGEAHYIHPDDAWITNHNNASYRELNVGAFNGQQFLMEFMGVTQQEVPAIYAWQEDDPNVALEIVNVPADGRFIIGHNVTDNGDGTWHYEYAMFNMYSDQGAQSITIPFPIGTTITNAGFFDIDYHSGEPYDGTDWTVTIGKSSITWATDTFDVNENANALRWSTLYNVRFDADAPPIVRDATLDLFKPGPITSMTVSLSGPAIIGDIDLDDDVDINDLLSLLGEWGACPGGGPCDADFDNDGMVGVLDLLTLLGNWTG